MDIINNENSLIDLMKTTIRTIASEKEYIAIKGVANYDLIASSVSLNIYAIMENQSIRLLDLIEDDSQLEQKWNTLARKYIDFGLNSLNCFPDQMFFEIDCNSGQFDVSFRRNVFHENYTSLDESVLFDYHCTNKVPESKFLRKILNKALIYHNEKTV